MSPGRRRLLVVIPDRVTEILAKGEFSPRYYNPGNYFDDVHLVLMNDDRPDPAALQPIVGTAQVTLHNFAPASFEETWFRVPRLREWAADAVGIARSIQPHLIRAYGHYTSTFAAAEMKRALGVPLLVSLHGNPDVDYYRGRLGRTWRQKFEGWMSRPYEVASLRAADMVLPVYSPIVPFLKSIGVTRYEVVYNAVGHGLEPRQSYPPKSQWRALCVGRQTRDQKNPASIIEALAELPEVELDLVGDGELHAGLQELARARGVEARVRFHRTMQNAGVLELMRQADLFVYQSDNYEISKGTMEASLAGLPVVLNRRRGGLADEVREGPYLVVDDTAAAYRDAIRKLIGDASLRADLGRRAAAYALQRWHPDRMEARIVDISRALIGA
jgi:glycosyltransferase involved in cell wall biosynthesis